MTIKHQLGESNIPKNPEKVVMFDFGILDTLDELGIEVAGLPQTNVPSYLSKYEDSKYANLGSLKEPDFEAIHALNRMSSSSLHVRQTFTRNSVKLRRQSLSDWTTRIIWNRSKIIWNLSGKYLAKKMK